MCASLKGIQLLMTLAERLRIDVLYLIPIKQ
jgi:hypothetical protein